MLERRDRYFALACSIFVALFIAMLWLSPWPSYPDRGSQAITDWWLVRIAAVGSVIALFQLLFFWWQLGAMRSGLADTAKQAKIAEETFQKIERPYLFVAKMGWRRINSDIAGGLEPGLDFVFTNGGKMPAVITEVEVAISRRPDGVATFTHSEGNSFVDLLGVLKANSEHPIFSSLPERFTEGTSQNFQIGASMHRIPTDLILGTLYYRLRVRYSGPFTEGHETGAAWEWAKGEFYRFGGATYNYTK
jgi:hypothetical protein